MASRGSTTLPLVLDIFWPSASRTRPCMYTVLKGAWPVSSMPIIIMRATQKKRMSCPVSSRVVGCHPAFMSGALKSGQPRGENGKRPDENHVSSTSSSWKSSTAPLARPGASASSSSALARASSTLRATMGSPRSSQLAPSAVLRRGYHAGMRCPHHSCRETHQSWMLSSHRNHVASWKSGMILSCPVRTASVARLAMGAQLTHH
mmetsp:Transcript_6434/g.15752  ORF Transcript_6434/g.15752 Transcript_6434/m.15752 type:complete len:205 (+) Transcript_6434:177-791(+)